MSRPNKMLDQSERAIQMKAMHSVIRPINSLPVFWLILSVPALVWTIRYLTGAVIAMDVIPPTGLWSARFMIAALCISPLITVFGSRPWTGWLLKRRRSFGVAAFGYAVLHMVFYIIDMEALGAIMAEITAPGIWTAWAAFLLFLPLAITSNDAAMRLLKRRWKQLQRLAYLAAVMTLAHWLLIHDGMVEAMLHLLPLLLLQILRGIIIHARSTSSRR